jgi:hypothetical protein
MTTEYTVASAPKPAIVSKLTVRRRLALLLAPTSATRGISRDPIADAAW